MVVIDPSALAGIDRVMEVFGTIDTMYVGYNRVPDPSVVSVFADPPTVSETWKVSVAELTT